MKTVIYAFINGPAFGNSDNPAVFVTALSSEGDFLAGHISSSVNRAKHDIGVTSEWKHKTYNERCPDGWRIEWVDKPREHEGVKAAYERHASRYGPGGSEHVADEAEVQP